MTVAEDDDLDVAGGQAEPAHVLDQPLRRSPRIEEHARPPAGLLNRHEREEPMLGAQGVVGVAAHVESRRQARRGRHRRPLGGTLIRQQRVRHVVHERGHRKPVDGLERDRFHPAVGAHGRASSTRLKGVSVARLKRVKPPAVTTSRRRASPACAPSAKPPS